VFRTTVISLTESLKDRLVNYFGCSQEAVRKSRK